jgi:hypothetical protein
MTDAGLALSERFVGMLATFQPRGGHRQVDRLYIRGRPDSPRRKRFNTLSQPPHTPIRPEIKSTAAQGGVELFRDGFFGLALLPRLGDRDLNWR